MAKAKRISVRVADKRVADEWARTAKHYRAQARCIIIASMKAKPDDVTQHRTIVWAFERLLGNLGDESHV